MTIYVINQFILRLVRSKYIDLSKIDINIIIPPIRVLKVVCSFKNNHTQNGLRAISMKKNKVTYIKGKGVLFSKNDIITIIWVGYILRNFQILN